MKFFLQVWRYGDRGVNGTYPTDPNKENSWRYGWQELTPVYLLLGKSTNEIFYNIFSMLNQYVWRDRQRVFIDKCVSREMHGI